MIRKSLIAAVVLGAASLATAQTAPVVYVGGHNPANIRRIEARPVSDAPYALTGTERPQKENITQNLWVGNRFAGARVVQK